MARSLRHDRLAVARPVVVGIVGRMPDHLRSPDDRGPVDDDPESWEPAPWARHLGYAADTGEDDAYAPITRPPWWRWVAIAVVLALVIGTPIAYLWAVLTR